MQERNKSKEEEQQQHPTRQQLGIPSRHFKRTTATIATTNSSAITSSTTTAATAACSSKQNNIQNQKKIRRYHHCYSFVQECQHQGKHYYCCPSYSSPGGIRSLLFQQNKNSEYTAVSINDCDNSNDDIEDSSSSNLHSSSVHSNNSNSSSVRSTTSSISTTTTATATNSTTTISGVKESHHCHNNNHQHDSFFHQFIQSHPHLLSHFLLSDSVLNWDALGNSDCYCCNLSTDITENRVRDTFSCELTLEPFVIQGAIDLIQYYYKQNQQEEQEQEKSQTLRGDNNIMSADHHHHHHRQQQQQQQHHSHFASFLSFLAFDKHDDDNAPHDYHGKSSQSASLHKHTIPIVVESLSSSMPSKHKHKDKDRHTVAHGKSKPINATTTTLEKATIIYHESARSIVFRDHLRRVHVAEAAAAATTTTVAREKNVESKSHGDDHHSRLRSKSNASHMSSDATSCTTCTSHTVKSKGVSFVGYGDQHTDTTTTNNNSHATSQSVASVASSLDASHGHQHNKTNHQHGHSQRTVHHQEDHQSISTMEIDDHHDHDDDDDDYDYTMPSNAQQLPQSTLKTRPQVIIANFTPVIDPLPSLDLESHNDFSELFSANPYEWKVGQGPEEALPNHEVWNSMSKAEHEVVEMLLHQKCCVKTIQNSDMSSFLQKFTVKKGDKAHRWLHPLDFQHASKVEKINKYKECDAEYNSFYTSLSLLPPLGLKMRCYGSTREYTTGVIFALPSMFSPNESEDMAAKRTNSWAWPSGYAAKTEFNISPSGDLINGREKALVSISQLRSNNHSYVYDKDYEVLGKIIKGGFHVLPYNEVFCRVGGVGRVVNAIGNERSFDDGLGLPIALFCRTATFGDLTALLRLRARFGAVLGKESAHSMPLLLIDPDLGTRVLTEKLQQQLLSTMSNSLNPFQNPHLRHKTAMNSMSEEHFHQKLQELLDLDDDNIRHILTTEECARLAGGFGATDESVAHLLMDAMLEDHEAAQTPDEPHLSTEQQQSQNKLQRIVNEGLCAAVRSGDFNTSRQLLILYTLVASRCKQGADKNQQLSHSIHDDDESISSSSPPSPTKPKCRRLAKQISSISVHKNLNSSRALDRKTSSIPAPPPPPPLDTDRLRSATNSDGLLAVLGAAEVLKSLQTGAASKRALEAAASIDEWIEKSEHSVAFRLASWRDLTAAQDDLKIATENNSSFMAFVSNKAISNRRRFSQQLRHAITHTKFEGTIEFLREIHAILKTMHSPCLRLELLQFILGLDNRYSVAHVARSIELAATCLSISASDDIFANDEVDDEECCC